jgi:hypothetical protein
VPCFVGFQGRGSFDERVELLRLIVDLVEASCYAENPEWRLVLHFTVGCILLLSEFYKNIGQILMIGSYFQFNIFQHCTICTPSVPFYKIFWQTN